MKKHLDHNNNPQSRRIGRKKKEISPVVQSPSDPPNFFPLLHFHLFFCFFVFVIHSGRNAVIDYILGKSS